MPGLTHSHSKTIPCCPLQRTHTSATRSTKARSRSLSPRLATVCTRSCVTSAPCSPSPFGSPTWPSHRCKASAWRTLSSRSYTHLTTMASKAIKTSLTCLIKSKRTIKIKSRMKLRAGAPSHTGTIVSGTNGASIRSIVAVVVPGKSEKTSSSRTQRASLAKRSTSSKSSRSSECTSLPRNKCLLRISEIWSTSSKTSRFMTHKKRRSYRTMSLSLAATLIARLITWIALWPLLDLFKTRSQSRSLTCTNRSISSTRRQTRLTRRLWLMSLIIKPLLMRASQMDSQASIVKYHCLRKL